MEVLIVSKTHMAVNACVGGLVLSNNKYVRLLNAGNQNQPAETDFNVGDVWDIQFSNRINPLPPHIEDVVISSKRYLRRVDDMPALITQRQLIDWSGHIDNLFDRRLRWTNSGSGYIPYDGQMPSKSVGFWKSNDPLSRVVFDSKTRFRYPNGSTYRNLSYVGFQDTIQIIPAGTIMRVSLSRLFPKENSDIQAPRGYYLQLSGWYLPASSVSGTTDFIDDLPF
ncbi:MAG: hypothetical protein VKL41_21895 [Snowella sp.]|nr:hypothetical protein [Snowella sp.]